MKPYRNNAASRPSLTGNPQLMRATNTSTIPRPIPNRAAGAKTPTTPRSGIRYVEVRVAIPADSPCTPDDVMQYIHSQSPSPMTVASSSTRPFSPHDHHSVGGVGAKSRPTSPYGFVPIGSASAGGGGGKDYHHHHHHHHSGRFTPPMSPYSFHKPSGTVSPSMMSILTEDTCETANMTLDSTSRMQSPNLFRPLSSPRPKSPTGKKSPFSIKSTASISIGTTNDDDTVRKTRIKTEMCMHYSSGRVCPFGADCTYAHGEEELQMTKLMDMHDAGLIDKDTYRTKPCLTWVSTGSCPFGKRCAGIHDPRIGGPYSSWLPQTETQGNTMTTDINVEALHQKRLHTILYNHPFGHNFNMQSDNWSDLYKLVCNIDYVKNNRIDKRRQRAAALNPIIKLQIALYMRGDADWQYKYRPQHVIHDELCMVLQKRAFFVDTNTLTVQDMALSSYNSRNPNHVLVREIAFGPDSDPSVRGVALWFNIGEEDVGMCTPQQAKRFRWKRSLNNNSGSNSSVPDENTKPPSVFDALDGFTMIRPHDRDAYDLVTDMMKHRLCVTQTERISNMKDRYEALQALEGEKEALKMRFENQKHFWSDWAWPINLGRENVDRTTPVPKVDGHYDLIPENASTHVEKIWKTFTNTNFEEVVDENWRNIHNSTNTLSKTLPDIIDFTELKKDKSRLVVFESLALGLPIAEDRTLPHIRHRHLDSSPFPQFAESPNAASLVRQKERCWKALLLQDNIETNEWNTVREHFMKSRSNKVLSIIQKT